MMQYALSPLPDPSWRTLEGLGLANWLWFDNAGVHLEVLPTERPVHATHLWGWEPGKRAARVRLDPDVTGGMVGAVLCFDQAPPPSVYTVIPDRVQASVWSLADGRISAHLPSALQETPDLTLLRVRATSGWGVNAPLTFVVGVCTDLGVTP